MDQKWVFLMEADDDLEADIVVGYLLEQGIPARKEDSSPYTGAMRVIGGLAVEISIYVPDSFFEEARNLILKLEEIDN